MEMTVSNGLSDLAELVQLIQSGANLEEICRNFGGTNLYIPSWKTTCRNEIIQKENSTGVSTRKLAIKYSLTEKRVYDIIKQGRTAVPSAQCTFEDLLSISE